MRSLQLLLGGALLLTMLASLGACDRPDYRPTQPQHSILDGPDRSQEWYKTNDDGK
jgi:hypothetical protein